MNEFSAYCHICERRTVHELAFFNYVVCVDIMHPRNRYYKMRKNEHERLKRMKNENRNVE